MTAKIMVGLAGVFPMVNPEDSFRIDTGPAVEVELTPWVESQLAAGSLVKFEAEAEEKTAVKSKR